MDRAIVAGWRSGCARAVGIRSRRLIGSLSAGLLLALAGCGGSSNPIPGTAATPTFSPAAGTYATAQEVTIASATAGAAIHYTLDGSTPTASSPTYAAAIHVAATKTINALATASGLSASPVSTAAYTINAAATPAATPTFSPAAGSYASAQTVAISSASSGASIYFTTNGTAPTAASTLYTAPILVTVNETISALASGGGFTASPVGSAAYVITSALQPAATPTFNPAGGTYSGTQTVALASTTPNAVIYYTTDSSTPTTASAHYTAPVSVATSETLTAIATATGFATSATASAAYLISSGTDFPTLCAQITTKLHNLEESCLQVNASIFTTAGGPFNRETACSVIATEISAGRVHYDSSLGVNCASDVQALGCSALVGSPLPASCNSALTGTIATGSGCSADNDCAAGYCTATSTQTCAGATCQPYASSGQSCQDTPCASGLVCNYSAATPTCTTPSAAGGACPCQSGTWCDSSGASPVCRAPIASGGTCSGARQCAIDHECVGSTCQALVGANGNCTAGAALCSLGYNCTANTCVSWPSAGQACTASSPGCIGGYCNVTAASPTCLAYVADGGTCTPSLHGQDCASGSCNATTSKCNPAFCSP